MRCCSSFGHWLCCLCCFQTCFGRWQHFLTFNSEMVALEYYANHLEFDFKAHCSVAHSDLG